MTSILKFGCLLNLLLFAALASAQDFNYSDGELIGKTFWVKPAKEIYRRLEFYRQPRLEGVTFFPSAKQQIRIVSVNPGWIKLNFVGAYNAFDDAFIPIGYFRRNLYSYTSYNSYAFDRATFFTDDPETIKARALVAPAPGVKKKGPPKSIASKFFRDRHKCCGLGNNGNSGNARKPLPSQR